MRTYPFQNPGHPHEHPHNAWEECEIEVRTELDTLRQSIPRAPEHKKPKLLELQQGLYTLSEFFRRAEGLEHVKSPADFFRRFGDMLAPFERVIRNPRDLRDFRALRHTLQGVYAPGVLPRFNRYAYQHGFPRHERLRVRVKVVQEKTTVTKKENPTSSTTPKQNTNVAASPSEKTASKPVPSPEKEKVKESKKEEALKSSPKVLTPEIIDERPEVRLRKLLELPHITFKRLESTLKDPNTSPQEKLEAIKKHLAHIIAKDISQWIKANKRLVQKIGDSRSEVISQLDRKYFGAKSIKDTLAATGLSGLSSLVGSTLTGNIRAFKVDSLTNYPSILYAFGGSSAELEKVYQWAKEGLTTAQIESRVRDHLSKTLFSFSEEEGKKLLQEVKERFLPLSPALSDMNKKELEFMIEKLETVPPSFMHLPFLRNAAKEYEKYVKQKGFGAKDFFEWLEERKPRNAIEGMIFSIAASMSSLLDMVTEFFFGEKKRSLTDLSRKYKERLEKAPKKEKKEKKKKPESKENSKIVTAFEALEQSAKKMDSGVEIRINYFGEDLTPESLPKNYEEKLVVIRDFIEKEPQALSLLEQGLELEDLSSLASFYFEYPEDLPLRFTESGIKVKKDFDFDIPSLPHTFDYEDLSPRTFHELLNALREYFGEALPFEKARKLIFSAYRDRFQESITLKDIPKALWEDSGYFLDSFRSLCLLPDKFWGDYRLSKEDLTFFAHHAGDNFGTGWDDALDAFWETEEGSFEVDGSGWFSDHRFKSVKDFFTTLKKGALE